MPGIPASCLSTVILMVAPGSGFLKTSGTGLRLLSKLPEARSSCGATVIKGRADSRQASASLIPESASRRLSGAKPCSRNSSFRVFRFLKGTVTESRF
ncbi:hypothetical protein [Succinimonas amylolytica]|uniref:hypothetical protein n=1 Tax=Succinimonas amylolytica TaxID=83769 RepID=UPI0023A90B58